MARQDVVRALLESEHVDRVVRTLVDELEVEPDDIDVAAPEPGRYRDEEPDLELHALVRRGRRRVLAGALIGTAVGILVALIVPILREYALVTVPVLAFGGAWGVGIAATARGVQLQRDEGSRGEKVHDLGPVEVERYRLLTVHDLRDRTAVVDVLSEEGATLLDSHHPRVGRRGVGRRPDDPRQDGSGPTAP